MKPLLIIVFFIVFFFALCGFSFGQNSARGPAKDPSKQTYLVVYKPGPKFLTGKPMSEQPLTEHFKYMVSLYSSGVMRFAGPFAKDAGGAVVFEAATEDEALKVVRNDPAVADQFFVFELNRWDLVNWDKYFKK